MGLILDFAKKLAEIRYTMAEAVPGFHGKGVTSGAGAWGIQEFPKIDHSGLVDILEKDGTAGFVVEATVKAALGIGYHYKHDGTPEGEEQVDILESWNNNPKIMMRKRNIEIGCYMYGLGLCMVEPVTPDFLDRIEPLPMRALWSVKRTARGGGVEYYEENLNGITQKFLPNEIIPFVMNQNADNPLGRGVLHRLAETSSFTLKFSSGGSRTQNRFSLYKAKQLLLNDLVKLWHNATPKSIWQITAKDSLMPSMTKSIEELDPGQRVLTNAKQIDIKSEMTDARNGFSKLLVDFNDEMNIALQSFLPKFFGQSPWTESSAITAERIWYNALVQNLQDSFREIKVARIDDLILAQHGFDENHTSYHWGMPKGPFVDHNAIISVLSQVVSATQVGVVSPQYGLELFNQLIDLLGDVGISLNTKATAPENMGVVTSKLAKALLDGNMSVDNRKVAEAWLNRNANEIARRKEISGPHKIVVMS